MTLVTIFVTVILSNHVLAFTSCCSRRSYHHLYQPLSRGTLSPIIIDKKSQTTHRFLSSNNQEDEEEEEEDPAMKEAFRQLDRLNSIDGNIPPTNTAADTPLSAPEEIQVPPSPPVSVEKEVQVYQNLVQEMEHTDETELYSDVLADMGGTPETTPKINIEQDDTNNTQAFLQQAFDDAMKHVKLKDADLVQQALNDEEIMKEIEQIFERGNEQLMASLEDIRKEQVRNYITHLSKTIPHKLIRITPVETIGSRQR